MNPSPDGPLVAKLGGSLWRSPNLALWIAALRRFPHGVTIVSGGGPFADAVRMTQPEMGFSMQAAHKMAMLGMEQYALALADLFSLALIETPEEAARARRRGEPAVWRPSRMAGAAPDIAPSWDVTSDSLSAWLARKTAAAALLLIKSVDPAPGSDLAAAGIVDACFPTYAEGLEVFVAGPGALATAGEILAQGGMAGSRFIAPREAAAGAGRPSSRV